MNKTDIFFRIAVFAVFIIPITTLCWAQNSLSADQEKQYPQSRVFATDSTGKRVPLNVTIGKNKTGRTITTNTNTQKLRPSNTSSPGPHPKMDIPEGVFDAGDVWHGTVINHEFVIRNNGPGELKILKAKPG